MIRPAPDQSEAVSALMSEGDELHRMLLAVGVPLWRLPTPAPGWTVAHQVAHLTSIDTVARLAMKWSQVTRGGLAAIMDPWLPGALHSSVVPAVSTLLPVPHRRPTLHSVVDRLAADGAVTAPRELLERWQKSRVITAKQLARLTPDTRIAWAGPSMSVTTMAVARLMETWAHGYDIADALGLTPTPTDRLQYIADLGIRTRAYSFRINGLAPPTEAVRVELTSPSGAKWTWGPPEAPARVSGPALDFCLVTTQRRHYLDTDLHVSGSNEADWLRIAQAFAGPPGIGRRRSH